MKADELMIGDWVLYVGTPMRITGRLIDDLEFNELNYIEREGFEPIPITPEILEKNGFMKETDGEWAIWNIGEEGTNSEFDSLYFQDFRKLYTRDWRFSFDLYGRGHGGIHIQYVHELQHALRLYGIEKDINIVMHKN